MLTTLSLSLLVVGAFFIVCAIFWGQVIASEPGDTKQPVFIIGVTEFVCALVCAGVGGACLNGTLVGVDECAIGSGAVVTALGVALAVSGAGHLVVAYFGKDTLSFLNKMGKLLTTDKKGQLGVGISVLGIVLASIGGACAADGMAGFDDCRWTGAALTPPGFGLIATGFSVFFYRLSIEHVKEKKASKLASFRLSMVEILLGFVFLLLWALCFAETCSGPTSLLYFLLAVVLLVVGIASVVSLLFREGVEATLSALWKLKLNPVMLSGLLLWLSGLVLFSIGFACLDGNFASNDDCYASGLQMAPWGLLFHCLGLIFMFLAYHWEVRGALR